MDETEVPILTCECGLEYPVFETGVKAYLLCQCGHTLKWIPPGEEDD